MTGAYGGHTAVCLRDGEENLRVGESGHQNDVIFSLSLTFAADLSNLAFTDPRYVLHNLIKDNAWCGRIHRALGKEIPSCSIYEIMQ